MRKIFLATFLALPIFIGINSASAQSQIEELSPRVPSRYWATTGRVLNVVISGDPAVRKRCSFVSIDDRKLVCKEPFQKTTTYLMSEVIAIIQPARKDPVRLFPLPFLAGCGALIYAAVVAGSAVATAGLSVAALVVLGVLGAMEVGDNFTSYDEILYQKPGTSLANSLHLKL